MHGQNHIKFTKIYLKFILKSSYMFRSMTIIKELVVLPDDSHRPKHVGAF